MLVPTDIPDNLPFEKGWIFDFDELILRLVANGLVYLLVPPMAWLEQLDLHRTRLPQSSPAIVGCDAPYPA